MYKAHLDAVILDKIGTESMFWSTILDGCALYFVAQRTTQLVWAYLKKSPVRGTCTLLCGLGSSTYLQGTHTVNTETLLSIGDGCAASNASESFLCKFHNASRGWSGLVNLACVITRQECLKHELRNSHKSATCGFSMIGSNKRING